MQEYDFIPQLNMKSGQFWKEAGQLAEKQEADTILAYMALMLEKATPSSGVRITKQAFIDYGKTVSLFKGVEEWFERIQTYAHKAGFQLDHYIISSGIKSMIEGTSIAGHFKRIFASSFMYDQNGVAYWPAEALNYTTKTQFLFRINKGNLNPWSNKGINDYMPKDKRSVPFKRMIYIGDGSTDVPCMKLVKDQGGHSIGVYPPENLMSMDAQKLLEERRVDFVAPCDYRKKEDVVMGKFTMIWALIAAGVTAWGLSIFQILTGMTGFSESVVLGIITLLFFVCTTALNNVLWEGKSWVFYCFNMTHFAVSLIGMSVIVGGGGFNKQII